MLASVVIGFYITFLNGSEEDDKMNEIQAIGLTFFIFGNVVFR